MEIMLYPLLILLSLCIKDSFIDKLFHVKNQLLRVLESQYSKGQRLYGQIMFLRADSSLNELQSYKFFNDLISDILNFSNTYGSPLQAPRDVIKSSLLKDLSRQKKMGELISSSLGQFFVAAMITWAFLFYSASILSFQISYFFIVPIVIWQVFGLITFLWLHKKLYHRDLAVFEMAFKSIYRLKLLFQIGIGVNEAIEKSNILSLYESSQGKLRTHLSRLESILEQRKERGEPVEEEMTLFTNEIWELFDFEAEKMEKRVTILRFLWLCLFYFSVYLIAVFLFLTKMSF
ncbi:hypothetical protein [Bacteriovorax sp. DB6_IX]|uniref:hypothetical protein n=1 Tax=Bacteriovorax sp. DB6_IX TaxID=1353530 RepID=UPI000389F0E3|nr:hypothetical protein [Bacteriovorax sp. DB6_IX]EQC51123.1 hypothetical protein M901_0864 [Bacteriovorax sp. DB6_IX]